jgi:hypothetical protein
MCSWEIGTLAEALTEYEWPWLSVFAPGSIPPPAQLREGDATDVLSIAERCVCPFPLQSCPTLVGGELTLMVVRD